MLYHISAVRTTWQPVPPMARNKKCRTLLALYVSYPHSRARDPGNYGYLLPHFFLRSFVLSFCELSQPSFSIGQNVHDEAFRRLFSSLLTLYLDRVQKARLHPPPVFSQPCSHPKRLLAKRHHIRQ